MKIVIFEAEPWERETFRAISPDRDREMTFVDGPLDAENAPDHADAVAVSTFIYSELGEKVLRVREPRQGAE